MVFRFNWLRTGFWTIQPFAFPPPADRVRSQIVAPGQRERTSAGTSTVYRECHRDIKDSKWNWNDTFNQTSNVERNREIKLWRYVEIRSLSDEGKVADDGIRCITGSGNKRRGGVRLSRSARRARNKSATESKVTWLVSQSNYGKLAGVKSQRRRESSRYLPTSKRSRVVQNGRTDGWTDGQGQT